MWVEDETAATILGPTRCLGEADNEMAIKHHNAVEDPERAFGDHPSGEYLVKSVHASERDQIVHYGPYFLLLDPISGDALIAKQDGRMGLGIHGGACLANGDLRVTYGCLRIDDAIDLELGVLVREELAHEREVRYVCRNVEGTT